MYLHLKLGVWEHNPMKMTKLIYLVIAIQQTLTKKAQVNRKGPLRNSLCRKLQIMMRHQRLYQKETKIFSESANQVKWQRNKFTLSYFILINS